jgi:cation diffusion facilitator CzcD-associated flavoprotein CzcO
VEGGLPQRVEVAIVGAGFGGLGAAISLKRAGIDDFVVLERSNDVGGTWSANTYPGCQCDVPSTLYSFSFAPKPDWTHSYPEQPQILEYARDCARRFGLMPKVAFGAELLEADWDEEERGWRIDTATGSLRARFLIAAPGLLSEPKIPAIPGAERFQGRAFHSASWDHGHDLTGRRVAVIGTGASAIQIVPRIHEQVERLYVLQRTPPWIIPHTDREIGPYLRRLYERFPAALRLARWRVYWQRELLGTGFGGFEPVMKLTEGIARAHLRRQVRDPELRRKLTPTYRLGCKRILLSNDWYPALQEPNVELVTDALTEIREGSLAFAGGAEREVDTIIWATGFSPTNPPIARRLRGAGGRTLAAAWSERMRAYLGTAVAGFPNLFLIYGPNTNLAHSSIIFMMEAQAHHVVEALKAARGRGAARVEVRREAQDAWSEWVQDELRDSVWNTGGCASWYLDPSGDNPIMWPGQTFTYHRRLRRFEAADYTLAA